MPAGVTSLFTAFTELVSTTYRNHEPEFKDNVSKNNALLRRLQKKGRMREEDGGLSLTVNLDYAENGTYQRYSGYDPLNISASDVLTSAEYPWRQVAVHVTANGLELRSNTGKSKIIGLAKSRLVNAMRSFKNGLSQDVYSDGTAANQINGLQALIADTGTGTVGQIPSATFPFWQNKVQSAAAPLQGGGAVVLSATTFESSFLLPAYIEVTRGDDQPDLIVLSNDYWGFWEGSQVAIKRYNDRQDADAGFVTMKYKNADVIFDGGSIGGGIPAAHGYLMNTDYLEMVAHRDANMTEMDEKSSVNQDAVVIPFLWQGNLVCSNRSLQCVLKA